MKLKRQYKKERLQIFANNSVSKNTMGILLAMLIGVATVGCPGSNTGGQQTGTFPYICPNGTPTAGMIATEDTISCSACNTGFDLTGTRCMAGPQTGTFPYICPDGTPTEGMIATEDTVSCSACNTGFDLTDTKCMAAPQAGTFPYICPNGTPTAGMIATQDTISCSACNTGFNRIGTRCTNDCTGTAISTATELVNIAATGDFHLTSDIDLTGVTWTPKAFNGCLNGMGNVISNLSLALPLMDGDGNTLSEYGLFSILEESAMIQNLGLEDVNITGMLTESFEVGSFAGINGGTIRTSYAHGQITITTNNSSTFVSISDETRNQGQRTGGLVGLNTGTIQESYAHVSIGSESTDSGTGVGGLVGHNSAGTIENSFATGGASSFIRGQTQVGGLVGRHQIVSYGGSRSASIANSYSIAIRTRGGTTSGGLVGLGEGYLPSSLSASIANSYSATQPLGASFLGGLVADANSDYDGDDSNKETTFTGKNYYTTSNGVNGLGDGSCAVANCIQATGATNAQRRTWLADTLNEADLGWSANIWNNLGVTGWPCLKKISNIFSGKDGCPPMAPFICPGGTATVGNSVTGSISCQSCTTALGYKLVASECVRFQGDFSRIGTAIQFGVTEDEPHGLASIGNTLYMVGGTTNSTLYRLDTSTGVATRVGSATTFGVGELAPRGIASIEDTLYMVGSSHDALYTLDTSTGVAVQVGSARQFGVAEFAPSGIASITDGGTTTLYMVGTETDALYTLDTSTGVAVQVGSATTFGVGEKVPQGLASIEDTLYMVGATKNALYTLDTVTGIATRVGATTDFGASETFPTGLESIGDVLYMVSQATDTLYKAVAE